MAQGTEAKLQSLQAAENMRRASREDILQPKIRENVVDIPSLGASVKIRNLTLDGRRELKKLSGYGTDEYDEERMASASIILCVVEPQLTEQDIETLREQDVVIIDELSAAVNLHNTAFGAVLDELKKGSSQTENSDTPSS